MRCSSTASRPASSLRLPHGEYIEIHQPLGPVDEHGHPIPLDYQGAPVPNKMNKLGYAGKPGSGGLFAHDPVQESEAIAAAEHEAEHHQLAVLREYQARISGRASGTAKPATGTVKPATGTAEPAKARRTRARRSTVPRATSAEH